MFPVAPGRRPMPPRHPFPSRNPAQKQGNTKGNVLAMFQDADGNLDIVKVQTTVKQISDIYNQVSPIVSRFRNK